MDNSSKFDFCPRCGALARDGVCQSGGFQRQNQQYQYQQPYSARPKKGMDTEVKVLIGVVISLAVVFLAIIAVLIITQVSKSTATYKEILNRNISRDDTRDKESSSQPEVVEKEEIKKLEQDIAGLAEGKYYTGPYDDIRTDLSYSVEMQLLEFEPEGQEGVYVGVLYPEITGDIKNVEYLNQVLEYEYDYFVEYYLEECDEYMEDGDIYFCSSEGFVTYMDEDVMSVVFKEIVMQNDFYAINYYCVNINIKDGLVMDNTEILDIDMDFAVDFRTREVLENGDVYLTNYTDEEILELLQNPNTLAIFYTPMGMEVGLNMVEQVIYVTYADYEKYIKDY